MPITDFLKSLNDLDISDLDLDNVGSWPGVIKSIVGVVLFAAVSVAGYYYHIEGLQQQLNQVRSDELELRRDFEKESL